MPKKIIIIIDGYLKTTRLGREGEKTVELEYSAGEALKLAQLELMGRDLNNHLPVLLRTRYEISPENRSLQKVVKAPKQKYKIDGRKSVDA